MYLQNDAEASIVYRRILNLFSQNSLWCVRYRYGLLNLVAKPIVLIPHDVFVQYFELNDSTPTKRKHYELAEEYSDYEVCLFLDVFVSRGRFVIFWPFNHSDPKCEEIHARIPLTLTNVTDTEHLMN
jgi:hypothetical protein